MKQSQQQQARNLYFETGLTQAQIAELVGITQKTMSLWANEGNWRGLKTMARETPLVIIDEMYSEVVEINKAIQEKEEGKRYASREQAEIRRKTLATIDAIREYQVPQSHAEVMYNFISYLRKKNPDAAKDMVKYAENYLKGEVKLGVEEFNPYPLHATPPAPEERAGPESSISCSGPALGDRKGEGRAEADPRWNEILKKFRDQSPNPDETNQAA